jgi:hypothetical protein
MDTLKLLYKHLLTLVQKWSLRLLSLSLVVLLLFFTISLESLRLLMLGVGLLIVGSIKFMKIIESYLPVLLLKLQLLVLRLQPVLFLLQ